MKAIKSTKDAFSGANIITNVMQGYNKTVRIDAKTRNYKPDMDNFFSKWVSEKYANQLCREYYGKNVSELNCYSY